MNSYINFILETNGAKERLGRLFQSAPEPETNEQLLPLSMVRKQRRRQKRSVRLRTSSPSQAHGYCAGSGLAAQRGSLSIEDSIWIASYVLAVLGLVKAAYSENPLLWLAIWPAPIAVASTIFIFFRHGFHFRNGVLILGRPRD
jgi:hypothetical protein